uniref:C2H2-type domain-containing protein n=1 Tax=Syphacia muris TaxID=451379 RepID=A0A0N5AYS8_9BILA
MKVFTVGLDEKPPLKEQPEPENVAVVPPPVIAVEKKPKKSYKGYTLCFATVFFVLFFAIIISEIAYNRARDESFFRLRWAELRHRMGMECNECNQRYGHASYRQNHFEPSHGYEEKETTSTMNTTPMESAMHLSDDEHKGDKILDPRFEFLRQILTKIREQAEKAGIDGTMRVSVIRINPVENSQDSSFLDGFGEVQQPSHFENSIHTARQADKVFGPWPFEDYYSNEDNSQQFPEVMANRNNEMEQSINGQLLPQVSNVFDSQNTWGNSFFPWAGSINQGQKIFEAQQPIQQPEYIRFLNIQQWPQQQQDHWSSYQQQPAAQPQWYNSDNQWQQQNILWQWQGNQWQPVPNHWNQWQSGVQTNSVVQQPQQTSQIQVSQVQQVPQVQALPQVQQVPQAQQQQSSNPWVAQQTANSVQDDNRWQASLQNNQWTVQRASAENNQATVEPAKWWNTESAWNNQVAENQNHETQSPVTNAIPIIQQQSIVSLSQDRTLPWTHMINKAKLPSDSITEQKVIVTSIQSTEKPTTTGQQETPLTPVNNIQWFEQDPYVADEVTADPQVLPIIPDIDHKSETVAEESIDIPDLPKMEPSPKAKLDKTNDASTTHIHNLPELELAFQNHEMAPFFEADASDEEDMEKIHFPAIEFPDRSMNGRTSF